MNKIFSLQVLLFLSLSGFAQEKDSIKIQTPAYREMPVFIGGHDDINTYRIPSVICTEKGTLLVFCEGRLNNNTDGSPTHLVLKRSIGNTEPVAPPQLRHPKVGEPRSRIWNMMWQPMQILLYSRNQDAYMNPVPVINSKDGTILLLVNRVPKYGADEDKGKGITEVWLLKSNDEGLTWSEPENITTEVGRIALGPGIGIHMKSGRLVVPVYDGVIYSDDEGETWAHGNNTTGPVSECQVVELSDGTLMLNTRGYPYRTVVLSEDGGESWGTPVKDLTLTDSELYGGCQASLICYTRKDEGYDKNRILFSCPADTAYRFNLMVRMSYDEGKTWPVSKLIKKGTAAYSCLTVFPDGSIGVIYETGNDNNEFPEYYANLSFARFNLEWLTNRGDWLRPVMKE